VPRGKDLPDLGACVGLSVLTAFELHAFLGESDFFCGQVEGSADFWDVREEKEGSYADWEGDYAVDDEEPVYVAVSVGYFGRCWWLICLPLPTFEASNASEMIDCGH
jgi:hypothetical protein